MTSPAGVAPTARGITAPHLESTVAALAFNRLTQESFEKHNCAASTRQESQY